MYTFPSPVTYTDPVIAFNPDGDWKPEYAAHIDSHFVLQVLEVPASMRQLAGPLTLGDTVTVTFYRDGDAGEKTRPTHFSAALDPELNHGYTTASFSPNYYEGRGFSIAARRPGDAYSATLGTCGKCGDQWERCTQQAWGNAADCEACKHHSFHSIGD